MRLATRTVNQDTCVGDIYIYSLYRFFFISRSPK